MTNFIRSAVASAALASLGIAIFATTAQAAVGQAALGNCYEAVVNACNTKPDHAVNPCINSGLDQCDAEHSASIQLPEAQINALKARVMRGVRPGLARAQ